MERATKALSLLSQTAHVKLEEPFEWNDAGLCDAKANVRSAMTDFTIMLPRLSGHAAGIFLTRMGLMLRCCIPAGRHTDESCGQDGEACAALLELAPCKVETVMEPVDVHYPHIALEQAYSTLHIALEGRPGLRNAVLQEIAALISWSAAGKSGRTRRASGRVNFCNTTSRGTCKSNVTGKRTH